MRSIAKLISAALLATVPGLVSAPAFAGDTSAPPTSPTTTGISLHILTLSIALKLGIDLTAEPYLNLGSNACGSLQVKKTSTCDLTAPAGCLTGCDPQSFATAAYNECHPTCTAAASASCTSACTSGCKSTCLADCNFDPVIACETGCNDACAATCADMEASGGAFDAVKCAIACDTTCMKACADVAAVSNIDNCGVQCSESCGSECVADANMACEIGCQTESLHAETSGCKTSCYASGTLSCDGKPAPALTDVMQCVELLKSFGVAVNSK
ncbi:MAG: hypothetical protein L6Q76_31000 [Polyangiaceae bacterium]|nr:hypothetical protein [Polyangiaceae bacterium]